jgi:MoaA/NifB/PqqE/SkfB family radical SAM enzyme
MGHEGEVGVIRHDQYNRFQKFKVLAHADKIKRMVAGEMPTPVEWVIYPSNICGYRCGHCIMAKEQIDHRQMLSEKAMYKIPDDAKKWGIPCVIFSGGGDPLLNPHTEDVAKRCKENGVKTGLNNQGYLLKDPAAFDFIRYSVDAATAETYQKIHRVPRGDGWERVNANIARHAVLRAHGKRIEMGLAFLITPFNWHEIELFCEWAQQYQPDFVHIRPAYLAADYLDKEYPGGDGALKDKIMPNLAELAKKLEAKYPNVYFRAEKFEGFWTPKLYTKCRATPLMAVTSGDGAFLVCQDRGIMAEENYLRWGNYNVQDFAEIWFSDDHRKVLDAIDLPKCPRCVLNGYNEIVEFGFVRDDMKLDLI